MPLANIEKLFIENLLQLNGDEAGFLDKLAPLNSLDEKNQLSIYRSNINGAHQKVLGQIYPASSNILGDEYFNQLCQAYRLKYPSTDPDLNKYGEFFSFFIEQQNEIHHELNEFEYLNELAWFEWCWHKSYYAKDDLPFNFEKLAMVHLSEQDKLKFIVNKSLTLHSTIYPLLDIWSANKGDIEDEQEFIMPDSETFFAVVRNDYISSIEILSKYQHELLTKISNGMSFIQVSKGEDENDFQNQLLSFIQKGWVTGFYL